MDWFETQTKDLPSPCSIVHIGAGTCRELESYQAKNPLQVFLVEPNPEMLAILSLKKSYMDNVNIIDCAVSLDPKSNQLNVLSDPNFSSLSRPIGLQRLMPGLTQVHQIRTNTQSAGELVGNFSLEQFRENWLVVDTPGVEAEVISSLGRTNQLKLFTHIFLRAGREEFYEGSKPISQIIGELDGLGYQCVGKLNQADFDWPVQHLCLNKFHASSSEVEEGSTQTTNLQSHVEELKSQLSIALKLQVLRESDLKDLQSRYSEALSMKNRQIQILHTVRERLDAASKYLKLIGANGDDTRDETASKLAKAISDITNE